MPVRCIKQIHEEGNALFIDFPTAILNAMSVRESDTFVCECGRHFDRERRLVRVIKETEALAGYRLAPGGSARFVLKDSKLAVKYGLMAWEYVELIFKEIRRLKGDEEERLPIFPKRMVEELDFTPED
ncbi:MAG: hypothetical protein NUW06_02505 [Candidatus Acetothermia bacterium]|jgi:hypothetical protein|nr:hypothetical protein [Candidatus Acetothermia bacterium]MDH7504562.1 hypothetical protein [Candidatus Acetothermia bacterium]